ncbi:M56 family metallopeptidase [Luteibacter sp. SG786]|uniref:M56 family metallopeptidase n=1 Tax=Luteibacter sp. SG786 TaxID=2587130 RepID=UPI00141F0FB1|nr:M56 family metallopeptidase [Luteibacter sp. SG786]NII56567.1 beta-lactamase regulating signal transducer with metallopeptidase domain [Luteibacter sp. SG786]
MDTFVDTLLSRLAYASVQAVLLAALVYAVCRLMPSLSAAARTALWWLLGAQLVLGLAWPTPIALPLLPAPAVQTGVSTGTFDATPVQTTTIAPQPGFTMSWTTVLLAVWAVAILIQLVVAGVRAYRLSGVVRRAMPHDDVRVDTLCARRARELGLRRSPRLAVSAEVDSPQVVGLWRPTILLPREDRLDDEELDMALMHELAHVRRGDLVFGWVPVLARTLFFFHPLVHMAMREYALCREAACDALVVSRGRQAPRTYGRLLLRLGVAPHPHHALPGASPTFRTLKRRIDMLGQATDAPPRVLTLCLVAVIAAIGVTPWRVVAADGAEAMPAQAVATAPATTPVTPVTPITPTTPRTPTTPTTVPRLSPPPVPAAPPAPRAPPAPPSPVSGPSDQTFIFLSGQITRISNGTDEDIQRARAERQGPGDYAWYRNGAQAWVLRDPAYVKRIREAYERARVPAEDAMRSAEKQAEIDRRQAMLNGQLAQLSAKQAELMAKQSDPSAPRDPAAYAAGNAAIGREQADIAKEIADLDKRRAAIGQEHVAQSRREADADRRANDEVRAIMDEAMHNHVAERSR